MAQTSQRGAQIARIPIEPELRDLIQEEKRGKENWSDVLRRIYTEWLALKAAQQAAAPHSSPTSPIMERVAASLEEHQELYRLLAQ